MCILVSLPTRLQIPSAGPGAWWVSPLKIDWWMNKWWKRNEVTERWRDLPKVGPQVGCRGRHWTWTSLKATSLGFPDGSVVKNLPKIQAMPVQSLGWEGLLEEGMATHSSILAWKILWPEEPGRLQSMMGSQSQTRLNTHTRPCP